MLCLGVLYGILIYIGDLFVIGIKDIDRLDYGDLFDMDGCVFVFWVFSLISYLVIKFVGEFIFLFCCLVKEMRV